MTDGEGTVRHQWGFILLVTLLLAATLELVFAVGSSATTLPAEMEPLATPDLLDEAVARGELDRATADEYLAHVFVGKGLSEMVPGRLQSDEPWDGTVPLLRLRARLSARQDDGAAIPQAVVALAAATSCVRDRFSSSSPLPNEATSDHFYISYGTIGGGLSVDSYLASLEVSYAKQVTTFGWAAPPLLASPPPPPVGAKYPVRVDTFSGGLYGFVSVEGTGAGFVGDNPNTSWNDLDAVATCMVIHNDFSTYRAGPQASLDATTAHEFNHSIQLGYGVGTFEEVDDVFFEGGATWMEDEVFDGSNDNYFYLWPNFRDSLGDYDQRKATGEPSAYPMWIVLRGLTERFGTGVPGGGEQVMQDFWEIISQNRAVNVGALALALSRKGVSLADAYHDFAVAAGFMRTCGGGYSLPFCFEEAAGYLARAGLPPVAGSISSVGGSFSSTIEDDYSLAWVTLPSDSRYPVTLTNNSTGGQLRASAVCDTGTALVQAPLPAVVGAGASTTLTSFSAANCVRRLAVITNQQQSPGNPTASQDRSFTLSTGNMTNPPPVPDRSGYWMLGSTGAVYGFGDAAQLGSPTGIAAANIAQTPSGNGYWVVSQTGAVHAYGDAASLGGSPALRSGETVSSLSPTPTGSGYWLFTNQGRALTYGTATFFGDVGDVRLDGPVLGSVSTPSGRGYYMVAADGGIFAFGDAAFAGSMGGQRLDGPVVGLAPDPDGSGYWLVASDGGIFAFSAAFGGSMGGQRLNRPMVGMVAYGDGYLMVASDGGVFNFSTQPFHGSLGNNPPPNPIIAIAPLTR